MYDLKVNHLDNYSTVETSLIWGNLRNLVDFDSIKISNDLSLLGTIPGEFPVRNFHPIFLEVPKSLSKFNMFGRKNFSRVFTNEDLGWSPRRIVSLPNYVNDKFVDTDCLKLMIQQWEKALIPEEIPCIAIGINITGQNSDRREGQYVAVLLIWSNPKARVLELDWFEGPLDDCIVPEWYLRVSEIMNPRKALDKMKKLFKIPPNWENSLYSIYCIPSCLGSSLQTKWEEYNSVGWKYQLSFQDHKIWMKALESILDQIKAIIS